MSTDTPLLGGVACTVEIRLEREQLSERMAAMRIWLDEHRFEPSVFVCHERHEGLTVSVGFSRTGEAEAFAERFGGHLSGPLEPRLAVAG